MAIQSMSNLDYHYLALELQEQLQGGRFNKAYAISPTRFRFRFHKEGERNMVVDLGVRAHLTRYIEEGVEPAGFVKRLREHLDNARVLEVQQLQFDRVLEFTLEKKQKFKLVLEQFAEGNMLLLNDIGVIVASFRREEWATRKIAPGQQYVLPPSPKKHPASIDAADMAGLQGGLVSALSKLVNLSPFYLEEVVARAGKQPREEAAKLTPTDKARLVESFESLMQGFQPSLYHEDFKPIAFAPIRLQKKERAEFTEFESFNAALDEYYAAHEPAARPASAATKKVAKLEHQLTQQNTALREFENAEAQAKAAGDAIFSNYQLVEGVLRFVQAQKENKTPEERIAKELEKASKCRARFRNGRIELEV